MVKFRFMIGVLEGYGHENDGMTPEKAVNLGTEKASIAMSNLVTRLDGKDVRKSKIEDLNVRLASAVYPNEFGGPKGGELGVIVEGKCDEASLPGLEERVKYLMRELGQSTVTIEKTTEDGKNSSTYISERGEKVDEYEENDKLETFKAEFKTRDLTQIGRHLQRVYTEVSMPDGKYIVSGVLTLNKGHVEFTGTQNPSYGQENASQYRQDTVALVQEVAKTLRIPAQVEFKDCTVAIEPGPSLKQIAQHTHNNDITDKKE